MYARRGSVRSRRRSVVRSNLVTNDSGGTAIKGMRWFLSFRGQKPRTRVRHPRKEHDKEEMNQKFGLGERVVVNEKAPGGYGTRLGTVREIVHDSRYGVTFDNQRQLIVYLDSECLDPVPQIHSSTNGRRADKHRRSVNSTIPPK